MRASESSASHLIHYRSGCYRDRHPEHYPQALRKVSPRGCGYLRSLLDVSVAVYRIEDARAWWVWVLVGIQLDDKQCRDTVELPAPGV